jgi:hypothetical protein
MGHVFFGRGGSLTRSARRFGRVQLCAERGICTPCDPHMYTISIIGHTLNFIYHNRFFFFFSISSNGYHDLEIRDQVRCHHIEYRKGDAAFH